MLASASFALDDDHSVEILSTNSAAGTAAINLTGNAGDQTLLGNQGANVLNGRGGIDTAYGYGGNDTYYVDNAGDRVFEATNGGSDIVRANTSCVLQDGQSIERLETFSTSSTSDIDLTGNDLYQTIRGNGGDNVIDGRVGTDFAYGLGGNDTYFVERASDLVFEAAGAGTDIVRANTSYALQDGQSVEVLATYAKTTTNAVDLTGNALNQTIYANAGNNVLNGKGGTDILTGYGGADTFVFDTTLGANNVDRITDYDVPTDTIQLENAIFTELDTGALDAAAFKDIGTGSADATDRILYDSETGALFYDPNGSAAGGRVQFALLDSTPNNLSNADFVIV